jgi:hypothetical protein
MSCESNCRKSSRWRWSSRILSVWRTSSSVTTNEMTAGHTAPKIQYCTGIPMCGKRETMNIRTSVELIENTTDTPTRFPGDICAL